MLLRFLLLSRTCSLVRFAKVIFFFFSRILFLLKFTCQKELRPLRGSEGAFNHSHSPQRVHKSLLHEGLALRNPAGALLVYFDAKSVHTDAKGF